MKERGLRDYFDALGSSPINYLYHAQYADKRITPSRHRALYERWRSSRLRPADARCGCT
jgi:hypothetical protein